MKFFNLPDLGEGLTEAEVVEWHVGAGDVVEADQILVSVETDKAIVDIPSPQGGVIASLCAEVGEIVETGKPLVEFQADDEEEPKIADSEDAGTVVGKVVAGDTTLKEKPAAVGGQAGSGIRATPAVRALASKMEVDLSIVSPSGPGNTITAEDVKRVAARLETLGPPEILRGARRVMATKMAQSGNEVVPATITDDADVEAWPDDTDVTIRLVRALVDGCKAEPALNAWFDSYSMGRRILSQIDIAIAVDTKDGLFTPVLRDVSNRDEKDLCQGLQALKADVMARKIPAEEMRGYTITLSNYGMIAGRYSTPVIVPPTVAILGAGRIVRRPVAINDDIIAHRLLPLSLTFDHRIITGGEAGRFIGAVIQSLES